MTTTALNAAIAKAVAAGKSSYSLPAKVVLDAPLVIPEGTSDFALLGRKGGTKLVASKNIGYAIVCGPQAGWDFWPIKTYPTATIQNVEDGAQSVTLTGELSVEPGDSVCVWDRQWVKHKNGDAQCNRMELSRVVSIEGKTVTLDRPVAREYDLEPSLTIVTGHVSRNITVEGIAFDARYKGGVNSGVLQAGLVDGLTCRDLETTDFGSRSVQVNVARDGLFERVDTRRGADIGNPGSGYGPTLMRCRDFNFRDCESEETRHGFMCTNGTTDVFFHKCRSLGTNGNFDTHGFDERRITWVYCTATGTLNVGNTEYLGGGRDFLAFRCKFAFSCWVSTNVERFTAIDCEFWGVAWQSQTNDKARPSSGRPQDVRFIRCAFNFQRNAFTESGDIDGLVFDDCKFVSGTDSYTQFLTLKWTTGRIVFRDTTVQMNGTGVYPPIALTQANQTFSLTLENFTLRSKAALWTAVQLGKDFKGSLVARGYEVKSARPTTVFLENLSTAKADLSLPLVTP